MDLTPLRIKVWLIKWLKKSPTPSEHNISDKFSNEEFIFALNHFKPGKALSPDHICSDFILHSGKAMML